VIEGSTDSVVATIRVGDGPHGICASSRTNRVYVANGYDDTLSVIDGNLDSVVATVPVGIYPSLVAINPHTGHIYVSCAFSNAVWVLEDKAGIEGHSGTTPKPLKLDVFPNPGNDFIVIKYHISARTKVLLTVCNVTGAVVKTLFKGEKEPGVWSARFDLRALPCGTYFVKVDAGGYAVTNKTIQVTR
jgi:YVTN family beta-propeller protein